MNNKIIEEQRKIYGRNYSEFGSTPRGTFQNDLETQYTRYEVLLKNLLPFARKKFSLHDVGSGICDLYRYLKEKNIDHYYSGTEIIEGMIDFAKNKYPEITIFNRDILETDPSEKYDLIVLSGTLNKPGNISNNEWYHFCLKIIEKMYQMAEIGISFNFLTSYRTFNDLSLFYFNPEELFRFCMEKLSRFVVLDNNYPLFESTITVIKKDTLKLIYSKKEFEKYFR